MNEPFCTRSDSDWAGDVASHKSAEEASVVGVFMAIVERTGTHTMNLPTGKHACLSLRISVLCYSGCVFARSFDLCVVGACRLGDTLL